MGCRYYLVLERSSCVGCNACVFASPKYFELGKDCKSVLKGVVFSSRKQVLGSFEKPVEVDFEPNRTAAESCPASCIEIFQLKVNKKGEVYEEKII